jgi:hypothetical protein
MRIVVIILAALLNGPIPSYGQQQQPPQNISAADQRHSTDHQNETDAALASKQSQAVENYAAEEAKATLSQANSNWWVVRITGALLFVGTIQAIIYAVQCFMMKRSIDQNRESSEAQLRAYINVETQGSTPEAIKQFNDAIAQGVYLLFVENTGQTPAYEVECFATWTSFPGRAAEWPENVRFKTVDELRAEESVDGLGTKGVLGAGQKFAFRCATNIQKDGTTFKVALRQVAENKVTVFIYGTIIYQHAFSKELRYTEFCIKTFRRETDQMISVGYSGYHQHYTAT